MKRLCRLILVAVFFASLLIYAPRQVTAAGGTTLTGSLPDGATYIIEVPVAWNGTLVLYSHGYTYPGRPNPAADAGDPLTHDWLLAHGYALAGSSYSTTGWAVQDGVLDQKAVLDLFPQLVQQSPQRTIAWGHSLGGLITALLIEQFPASFSGALPMCGVLAGGTGLWNQGLDSAFAFKVLLGPASLQLVHITDPVANLGLAEQALAAAVATPQGQARLALVAALSDMPGWYDPALPQPAPFDFGARLMNQVLWDQHVTLPFGFAFRADLEAHVGGNPSSNVGVNYLTQLLRSTDLVEVLALYSQAHLSLAADLGALQNAPKIAADPAAATTLAQTSTLSGRITVPVLTIHTTGDGLVTVQNEQAYAHAVQVAGRSDLLRQGFVDRAGHCSFTPAETIAAFQTLVHRLDSGHWDGSTVPSALNAAAIALGPAFNVPFHANYVFYQPSVFLRPSM